MFRKIVESSLAPAIIISLSIIYSCYWLFLSSDIFWRNSVGNYNIVFLCFFIVFSLLAIIFLAGGNTKWYTIVSFIAFIPSVIVCFINRYSRYPDFSSIASQYVSDNSDDPISTYVNSMYSESWKFYEYIVSRSGKASSMLLSLTVAWAFTLLYSFFKKE